MGVSDPSQSLSICIDFEIPHTNRPAALTRLISVDKEHVSEFISRLDGQILQGRRIHVRFEHIVGTSVKSGGLIMGEGATAGEGHGKASADFISVYMGNVPWHLKDDTLRSVLSKFEPAHVQIMRKMSGLSRGFAIVKFKNIRNALKCIETYHGKEIDTRTIECRLDTGLAGRRKLSNAPSRHTKSSPNAPAPL